MSALFEANGNFLALDSSRVEEIVRVPAITPVRGSPPYILGIANLRGRIITVLDIAALLGFGPASIGDGARILVAESGGEPVGILVEALHDVVETEHSGLRPIAQAIGAARESLFLGAFEAQGRTAALLDLDAVLAIE